MKKKNLLPLVLFCVVFLAYSLYFVKVISTTDRLEPNSIAKTIKRAMDEEQPSPIVIEDEVKAPLDEQNLLDKPITRYVNYRWLNVRQKPSLASPVQEKILKDASVQVLGYPTASWAFIKTEKGTKGYVARRYLRDTPPLVQPTPTETETVEVTEPAVEAPVSEVTIYDVPVITYHHISDDTDLYAPSLVLPEVNLFAQLDYLIDNGFTSYTFYDLKAVVDGKKQLDEKPVILTFNGGYIDAYLAAQHLNGKGLKGVFFITTDKIGTDGFLDWRQVKKMHSWGMEIGSMGVTGANLLTTGDFYIKDEIQRSKKIIEEQLGTSIISFAYANGGYNNAIMKIVEEAGYLFARTSDDGSRFTDEKFMQIPTLRVFFPAGANQFRVWLGE